MQTDAIPSAGLDSLYRTLLAAAEKFYSDPANVKAFEDWKAARGAGNPKESKKKPNRR